MGTIHSYRELIVWQRAIALTLAVYQLTANFPREEQYGLVSQMRRAAVSIPSNIAEGRCRSTKKDFLQFIRIAYGSGAELETQLEIAQKLSFGNQVDYNKVTGLLDETMRMLNAMLLKLNPKLSS